MNYTCRNCFLFIVSCFIFTHCTKSTGGTGGNTVPPNDTTVYIAGDNGTNPILWKNGKADTLSQTSGTAYQVLLSGNDVYVGGVIQKTGMPGTQITGQYVYWINGTSNNVGSFGNVDLPASIAVSGADVYFANGLGWKNGAILLPLPGILNTTVSQGNVRATFASGSDIYFAGMDSNSNAVDWKNSTMSIVSAFNRFSSNDAPIVSCLNVSGTDVYVGGMLHTAVYWKNGTANYLPYLTDGSFVPNINSVFVVGNDVYSTGQILQLGNHTLGPAYWKDTVEQDLQVITPTSDVTTYTPTSIFVFGTDIYVAGFSSTYVTPQGAPLDSAIYWKNGIEISLHSSGTANSIFVK
jgi:hypothetical protein